MEPSPPRSVSSPVSPSPFSSRNNMAEHSSFWAQLGSSWLLPYGCMDGFQPHHQELKAETSTSNHEMHQFLFDSEAAMAKIRDLQHRICRLENQLEFLRSERDILEMDLKHREADFKSLKRENEKKLEEMQEKNFELSSRFREANNQCASLLGRIAELHETNTRMERDLRITQHLLELERNANSEVEVANAAVSTDAPTNTPTTPENTSHSADALYISASPVVRRRLVNSVHCSVDQNNNDDFVARSLWITGLTRETKAIDLKKICKEFGKFIRAKVFEKQRSLACFGFVTMGDVAAAEKAIAALDATQINGALVSVRKADTLDTATLEMLSSAKTVRNGDPRSVNVTVTNVNAASTITREDSKNSRPSRSFPLVPPRQCSHRTTSSASACRRDSPPNASSTHYRKPERSERSSFVAPPNPKGVSDQARARAKKRRSNEGLYVPPNRMTREEEALKKEREQLERDRRDLEEHRRKVELLITLQQQKLERASSPFASPHCSRRRSRSQHGQHRSQSKVRNRNRRDGLYSSHRYPTPIDRRISRSPPPVGDRYDGEWESKERRRDPSPIRKEYSRNESSYHTAKNRARSPRNSATAQAPRSQRVFYRRCDRHREPSPVA
ncbi:hypothetical protein ANCCAN_01422 [Ancylostoma caninum]|uniref:RRM domain-containing protein n=1 Tax=Ancylostoma caninum TaxID=29170 RepID=A0A368HAJ3_ANCCA|nr:hypothetical protein ANCCAN_01422 [Ancylostoma caninum]